MYFSPISSAQPVNLSKGRDENVSKMDVDSVDSVDGRRPNVDQDLDQ